MKTARRTRPDEQTLLLLLIRRITVERNIQESSSQSGILVGSGRRRWRGAEGDYGSFEVLSGRRITQRESAPRCGPPRDGSPEIRRPPVFRRPISTCTEQTPGPRKVPNSYCNHERHPNYGDNAAGSGYLAISILYSTIETTPVEPSSSFAIHLPTRGH